MKKSILLRLKERHKNIARLIAKQERSRNLDSIKVGELKKIRLLIKDRISQLERALPRHEMSL
jgi:hypothetical protein